MSKMFNDSIVNEFLNELFTPKGSFLFFVSFSFFFDKNVRFFFSGGAFGVFEATDDISDVCKAKVFRRGTKTRLLMRFSTVGKISTSSKNTRFFFVYLAGENGSADTVRDPRGFAIKMYTDEGKNHEHLF